MCVCALAFLPNMSASLIMPSSQSRHCCQHCFVACQACWRGPSVPVTLRNAAVSGMGRAQATCHLVQEPFAPTWQQLISSGSCLRSMPSAHTQVLPNCIPAYVMTLDANTRTHFLDRAARHYSMLTELSNFRICLYSSRWIILWKQCLAACSDNATP